MDNSTKFPPISIDKLKRYKYKFGENYNIIKANLYQDNYYQLINILDIWLLNDIYFMKKKYIANNFRDVDRINLMIKDIEKLYRENQNLKIVAFNPNGNIISLQGLYVYYDKLVKMIDRKDSCIYFALLPHKIYIFSHD